DNFLPDLAETLDLTACLPARGRINVEFISAEHCRRIAQPFDATVDVRQGEFFPTDLPPPEVARFVESPGALLPCLELCAGGEHLRHEPRSLLVRTHGLSMFLRECDAQPFELFGVTGEPVFDGFVLRLNQVFALDEGHWKSLLLFLVFLYH